MESNFDKIVRAMFQVFLDLRNTLGSFAWVMLAILLVSTIFVGYYVMYRLLHRRPPRSTRRFLLERRLLHHHLQKR